MRRSRERMFYTNTCSPVKRLGAYFSRPRPALDSEPFLDGVVLFADPSWPPRRTGRGRTRRSGTSRRRRRSRPRGSWEKSYAHGRNPPPHHVGSRQWRLRSHPGGTLTRRRTTGSTRTSRRRCALAVRRDRGSMAPEPRLRSTLVTHARDRRCRARRSARSLGSLSARPADRAAQRLDLPVGDLHDQRHRLLPDRPDHRERSSTATTCPPGSGSGCVDRA